MHKKLTKHGNSLAMVFERPILDLIDADGETDFKLTTDGKSLTLTPACDEARREKFQHLLKKTNQKYGKALKRLAE